MIQLKHQPHGRRTPSDQVTIQMSKSGLSREAIAGQRDLKIGTVTCHINAYRRRLRELFKTKSPEAVPELIDALRSADAKVRVQAVHALGKLGDRRAVQPLVDLLGHETAILVRCRTATALGRLGGKKSLKMLQTLADSETERWSVSHHAEVALRKSRGQSLREWRLAVCRDRAAADGPNEAG